MELVCRLLEVSPSGYYEWLGRKPSFAPAEGSGTETPAAEPAPALSRPWAGQPVSPDPPAAFLLAQAHPPPDERDEHLLHTQACLQSHDQLKTRAPHRAQSSCAPLLPLTSQTPHGSAILPISPPARAGSIALLWKDLCTKQIVGYAFSDRIDTNLTLAALGMAVRRRKPLPGLIFHSDRGVQYAAYAYRQRLASLGIRQSMSRKGRSL